MKKIKRPIFYYLAFSITLLVVIINLSSLKSNFWTIAIWGALAILTFALLVKKNKQYKDNKLRQKKLNDKIENQFKDFYYSVLNEQKINDSALLVSQIAQTEKLNENIIKSIRDKMILSIMDEIVKVETAEGSLSPTGYNRIVLTAQKLDISIDNQKSKESIEKLRKYWELENGDLPVINTSISLQKDEVCFYQDFCKWFEHRKITKSVSYSGITGSLKITKGVRYRVGNIKPKKITVDTLSEIDNGTLFITNKRIIFMGTHKNINIKYSSILAIVPYSDGVGIEKDSGKSPILGCNNPDILSRILARLNK